MPDPISMFDVTFAVIHILLSCILVDLDLPIDYATNLYFEVLQARRIYYSLCILMRYAIILFIKNTLSWISSFLLPSVNLIYNHFFLLEIFF